MTNLTVKVRPTKILQVPLRRAVAHYYIWKPCQQPKFQVPFSQWVGTHQELKY